jgi:hypothetical protein
MTQPRQSTDLTERFVADDHASIGEYKVFPIGEYNAEIKDSQLKLTKKAELEGNDPSKGQYANLQFVIMDGKYKGGTIWQMITIQNPNPIALEIGQKELSTLCRAVALVSISNTVELHNKPMTIVVSITEKEGDNPERNKIKNYKPYKGEMDTSFDPKKLSDDSKW